MRAFTNKKPFIPAVLLLVGVLALASTVVGSSPDEVAEASDSPTTEFAALAPVTDRELATAPKLVRDRLDFRLFSFERQYGEEGLRVSEFGQVQLPEGDVYLAGIRDSVCAFFARGIGICGERSQISQAGVVGVSPDACNSNSVLGIVPADVAKVTFDSDGDGTFEQVTEVVSNVYSATLETQPTHVRALGSDGEIVFTDLIPLDDFVKGTDICS